MSRGHGPAASGAVTSPVQRRDPGLREEAWLHGWRLRPHVSDHRQTIRLGALELEQAIFPTLSAHMDPQALPRPAPSAAESPSPGFTEAPVQSQAESLDDELQNSYSGCHRSSGGPSSPPLASQPGHLEHSLSTCRKRQVGEGVLWQRAQDRAPPSFPFCV